MADLRDQVDDLFPPYGALTADQAARLENCRVAAYDFAVVITQNTAASSDQSAAVRQVREALMTAHAAIALEPVTQS